MATLWTDKKTRQQVSGLYVHRSLHMLTSSIWKRKKRFLDSSMDLTHKFCACSLSSIILDQTRYIFASPCFLQTCLFPVSVVPVQSNVFTLLEHPLWCSSHIVAEIYSPNIHFWELSRIAAGHKFREAASSCIKWLEYLPFFIYSAQER